MADDTEAYYRNPLIKKQGRSVRERPKVNVPPEAMAKADKGYIQRGLEGLGSFFTSSPEVVPDSDMSDAAVSVLAKQGIADPRIGNPNLTFRGVETPWKELKKNPFLASVESSKPDVIRLNRVGYGLDALENPMNSHTLAHEVSHSQAYSGGKELEINEYGTGRSRGDVLLDNYYLASGVAKPRGDTYEERDAARKAMLGKSGPLGVIFKNIQNPKLKSHLKKNYHINSSYIGDPNSIRYGPMDYEEIAADLTSAMQHGKKDIFEDPFLVKNLFNNDPYLMAAVSSTLNAGPRMDAKDPPRFSLNTGLADKYKAAIAKWETAARKDERDRVSLGGKKKYASGGAIQMPQEYSQGNLRLI
jgi:hypothetical protein